MFKGSHRAQAIKGPCLLGQREKQHAARLQDSKGVVKKQDGIGEVLDYVIGNQKVLRTIGNRTQRLSVIDDIWLRDASIFRPLVVLKKPSLGQTINVFDFNSKRHR